MTDTYMLHISKGKYAISHFHSQLALRLLCLSFLPTSLFANPMPMEDEDPENETSPGNSEARAQPTSGDVATPGEVENPPPKNTAATSESPVNEPVAADGNSPTDNPPAREPLPPLNWLLVINPLVGWLHNSTSPTVKSKSAGGEETTRQVTFEGSGWGAGLVITGFYRFKHITLQAANISYLFPDVNSSIMWGNITQVINSFNLPTFIDPYIGFTFAYVGTKSELSKYVFSVTDTRSDGTPTVGYAYFPHFTVKTENYQYAPRVGLTFKIPIQNWRVRPYYEYAYEDLYAHAKTVGSKVNVFERESGYRTDDIDLDINDGQPTIVTSHVIGISFGIDYHSFLQLYGNVNYNLTHNLISARFMGTILLPRHWGFTVTYEHQEMCMTTNDFVMFGPTFFFMPPKFMDRIIQMKDEAMEKRRQEKEKQSRSTAAQTNEPGRAFQTL